MAEKKEESVKPLRKNHSGPKSSLKILGYYSIDGDRNFIPDMSQLRYFNPPEEKDVYFDLDEGIESAVRRSSSFEEEGIDLLLKWLELNHKKLQANPASGRYLQPKFICTRGTLTRILTARIQANEPWTIYAAKLKGSIYLCTDKSNKTAEHHNNDKYSSWGHKFEQYVLSDSPDQPPDTSKPVVEPAEFRAVYQRRIGNYPVLFCAIVKGVCSEKALTGSSPIAKLQYIDIKTNKTIENRKQEVGLKKGKFLRWWSQCYLTDTKEILCGFRDDSGVVQRMQRYNINELITQSKPYWNPETCISFCQSFLTKISDTVVDECDQTLYRFESIPRQGINITSISNENQYGFIPESYVEALG